MRQVLSDLKEMAAAGVLLREIFRRAASETLGEVLAIEDSEFLGSFQNTILEDGSPRFILNGRTFRKFAAPCGVLDARQPRLRDKAGGEKKMVRDSLYLPAFIRRTKEIEDIFPYLYLKSLSTEGINTRSLRGCCRKKNLMSLIYKLSINARLNLTQTPLPDLFPP
ncbi:MAG: hypothetical protein LBK52_07995 [Deltaproteobacteria bacterium]|nr:hypothetical protein [Deltaproteobacteria bacterium]